MRELHETEVLILGCGIAGGTVALQLAESGVPVTIATRSKDPRESNTLYAQGGIIYKGKDDPPSLLQEDILRAGAGHCNPKAVIMLAEEGPAAVQDVLLENIQVPFDRQAHGELSLVREGGHSKPRIIHAADATGRAIEIALIAALQAHPNVTFLTEHTAIDLLTPSHHSLNRLAVYEPQTCIGAYLFNHREPCVLRCLAKQTVLATGGLGQIFLRTTNPPGSRGDGLAMANRAGARIVNAEFIQFHPTTFYHPQATPFLISEAVRGAGARLVHADGEPFMQRYDAEWKDLAPRDVVARSIHHEMLTNDVPNVFLDLRSYIPEQTIREHFPTILQTCLEHGIDITRQLTPVVPAAHYSCGGVWVDEWGQTTLRDLYAVGEVACTGLHGANRLASTSLLEGLVWGKRTAQHILATMTDHRLYPADQIPPWRDESKYPTDPALISQDMSHIKHIMWNYVGLIRSSHRLNRAIRELQNLENEIEQFYRVAQLTDSLIGLRNAVRAAILVTFAAWSNKTSMGCHYRE